MGDVKRGRVTNYKAPFFQDFQGTERPRWVVGSEFVVFLANTGSGNLLGQWDWTEVELSLIYLEEVKSCNHTDLLDLHGIQTEIVLTHW